MELDTNSWHFKIYKRWLQLKTGYTRENDVDKMLRRAKFTSTHNFCLYMRVVMFWGPLRMYVHSIASLLLTFILLTSGLIWLEMYMYGSPFFVLLSTALAGSILGVIVMGGAIVGIVIGTERLKEKWAGREVKEKRPSIVWEYVKAKKQKICPVLSFKDDSEAT